MYKQYDLQWPRQLGVSLLWPQPETGDWSNEDLLWLPTDLTTARMGCMCKKKFMFPRIKKNNFLEMNERIPYLSDELLWGLLWTRHCYWICFHPWSHSTTKCLLKNLIYFLNVSLRYPGPWDPGTLGPLDLGTLGPWDSWTSFLLQHLLILPLTSSYLFLSLPPTLLLWYGLVCYGYGGGRE